MAKRKKGSIISISSVCGDVGLELIVDYVASKHGLHGLTKTMAMELGPYNVRVNAVAPSVHLTPMARVHWTNHPEKAQRLIDRTPIGRFGEPEEVSNVILFLASDAASNITGEIIHVDGGACAGWFGLKDLLKHEDL
jgi:NAD(P)-dependent dehydrogenase (short-subunit alcohol dehydrogenase family)